MVLVFVFYPSLVVVKKQDHKSNRYDSILQWLQMVNGFMFTHSLTDSHTPDLEILLHLKIHWIRNMLHCLLFKSFYWINFFYNNLLRIFNCLNSIRHQVNSIELEAVRIKFNFPKLARVLLLLIFISGKISVDQTP